MRSSLLPYLVSIVDKDAVSDLRVLVLRVFVHLCDHLAQTELCTAAFLRLHLVWMVLPPDQVDIVEGAHDVFYCACSRRSELVFEAIPVF